MTPMGRRLDIATFCLFVASGCQHSEPRWLIDRLPGNYPEVVYYFPTTAPAVALTIDDGPDPKATPALLRVLAQHHAKATFFLVSDAMQAHPELVRRIVDHGHELGNHLTEDEPSAALAPEEFRAKLAQSKQVIDAYRPARWFRPGHARYNQSMLDAVSEEGYRVALASMIPLDARLPWPALVGWYMNWSLQPGSVLVLHSVGKRGLRSVAVLERLLPRLRGRGYSVLTLSALDALAEAEAASDSKQDAQR